MNKEEYLKLRNSKYIVTIVYYTYRNLGGYLELNSFVGLFNMYPLANNIVDKILLKLDIDFKVSALSYTANNEVIKYYG